MYKSSEYTLKEDTTLLRPSKTTSTNTRSQPHLPWIKEKGERRKEKGERRKEEGGRKEAIGKTKNIIEKLGGKIE